MSWKPEMVALDIDGTVVDLEGNLPSTVVDAVQRVLAAGTPVVLATGRSWQDTKPIHEALGLQPGPAVTSNGAVVVDYPPLHLRKQITFDPAPAIRKVLGHAPHLRVAVEDAGGGYRVNTPFPDGDLTGQVTIQEVDELCAVPVTRVIIRDPNASSDDFKRLAKDLGMHGVSYSIGWSAWLDIAPVGVNKASGLKEVVAEFKVKRKNVLAMGDGRNDVHMLKWAGRGVAMGDAPDEVKKCADHVTGNFADGGTIEELSRWF
ncbi:HAD family hydrolase [Luteococcus sp. OSA5]|uniref:HAD family hydrolase n=1 Tax=Luteococcus sp. OSA5 TaxID=3401630 RepID=UPI003B42E5A4